MNSSIVSYRNRGPYGNSKYRGNCSGYLIADLLDYYQPKRFVEVFAGGGTGADVAKSKGIRSIHLDLNPQFGGWNALTDDIPTGADLIFSHPPYHSMVVYSGNMWVNLIRMTYPGWRLPRLKPQSDTFGISGILGW